MPDSLLIYGATGSTGPLLALAARERGLAPVLCGRSEAKCRNVMLMLAVAFDVVASDRLVVHTVRRLPGVFWEDL